MDDSAKTIKNRVLLFYNPKSGNGMFKNNLDYIISRFQEKGILVVPVRADNSLDIDELLQSITKEKFLKIIAAGGDGTINIVVNAMRRNDIDLPLAVFPAGTANDFAHYFEIPTDLDGMLDIALEENYIPADIGICNGRYFVNVAAIGSVIDVSQKTDSNMKNALGILSYYLKALSELHTLKPVEVTVTTPAERITENIYFMVVLNGNSAGGFRKLGVESAINDGLLDVIMFKEMKLTDIAPVAISVLQGRHKDNSNVIYLQTPSLTIESPEQISTDIDGEMGEPLPLRIELSKKQLLINTAHIDEPVLIGVEE